MLTPAPKWMRRCAVLTFSPLALAAAARCGAEAPSADWGGTRNPPWEPGLGSRARCRELLTMPPITAETCADVHGGVDARDASGGAESARLAERETRAQEYFL